MDKSRPKKPEKADKSNMEEHRTKEHISGIEIRRQKILDHMQECGFVITEAARATGLFSESYIRGELRERLNRDRWFQHKLKLLRDRTIENSKDELTATDTLVSHIIDTGEYKDQKVSPSVLCKLLELKYRRLNAFLPGNRIDAEHTQERPTITKADRQEIKKRSLKLIQSMSKGA
jgi:hypothetical protein